MKSITALWIASTAALLPGVYTQGSSSATAETDARGEKGTTAHDVLKYSHTQGPYRPQTLAANGNGERTEWGVHIV